LNCSERGSEHDEKFDLFAKGEMSFAKKQAEGDPDSGPEDRDLDELILALEAADLCREWLMDIRDRMLDRARERKPDEPA
jgi:hypothetical protein